jgi:hypothetical protein
MRKSLTGLLLYSECRPIGNRVYTKRYTAGVGHHAGQKKALWARHSGREGSRPPVPWDLRAAPRPAERRTADHEPAGGFRRGDGEVRE